MKKRTGDIYLIIIIGLLLGAAMGMTSCGDGAQRKVQRAALARAEALMESDPHAARAVLDSLGPHPIPPLKGREAGHPSFRRGRREAALYALLRTQADYKCNVRLTSDSLPLIATRYYGTKRKSQYAALAQHYLGCAYQDMHQDLDAIDAFLRATSLFPDTTNKYFANNLFYLGILYSNHHMHDNAWNAFNRYRHAKVCISDSVNIGYADYYMGSVALFKGSDDVADSLFRCVERNTTCSDNIHYNTYFQLAKQYYHHKHDIEKSLLYLNKLGGYFGPENGAVLSLKADILAEQQQPAQAYKLYKKAIEKTSDIYTQCTCYKGLASIASSVNSADSISYYISQYKSLVDTIYTQSKQKEIAEVRDKHIVELHDQQLKARHVRFIIWVVMGAVVLISGTIVSLLLADRKRKRQYIHAQEELRQANVDVLQAQVDEKPADMDALYRKKLAACQNLFRRSSSSRLLLMPPTSLTPEQRLTLKNDLTRSFVDIMMDVKNASNAVNDQELMYCILSSLQCSTAQMAVLLNTTESTLRTRKARLKEKMPASLLLLFFS